MCQFFADARIVVSAVKFFHRLILGQSNAFADCWGRFIRSVKVSVSRTLDVATEVESVEFVHVMPPRYNICS